ncbi:MAG: hypothetical protein HY788_09725 [Deltaproteobacteria bacterium]|nr:hypothetical protein [Deltaproteobacteria bacterium]
MESMNELMRMMAMCENARTARKEGIKDTCKGGRVDPTKNNKKQMVALLQAAGLSNARINEHLDQLEK